MARKATKSSPNPEGLVCDGIKCERVEVLKILPGDDQDGYRRLRDMCDVTRKMSNTLARKWVLWHEQQGNFDAFLEFERERAAAVSTVEESAEYLHRERELQVKISKSKTDSQRAKLKGKFKGWANTQRQKARKSIKLPFHFMPKECASFLYYELSRLFPHVHVRTRTLMQNSWQKKLTRVQDGVNDWYAVFAGMRSMSSARDLQPVPFDKCNGKITPVELERGLDWHLKVRVSRDGESGDGVIDTLILKTRGNKKLARVASVLRNCFDGTFAFKGSSLFYDQRKNKFFVLLAYQRPSRIVQLCGEKSAVLRAGDDCPLVLDLDGKEVRIISRGDGLAPMRQHNFNQRRLIKGQYKYPAAGEKGHGRKRGQGWRRRLDKLGRDWNEFVKRHNHSWSRSIVRFCVDRGIGQLTFEQPRNAKNFVSQAGQGGDVKDQTTWQWFQLKTMLSQKCQEAGIVFVAVDGKETKAA